MANFPTVGNHQQGAFTTPINGDALDATVVLSNDNATRTKYDAHDSDPLIHVQSSALASRPAAGTAGRVWMVTDSTPTAQLYRDTGAAWENLGVLAGSVKGGIFPDTYAFSGDLTFGTTSANIITVNSQVASGWTPSTDGARSLGSTTKRWLTLNSSLLSVGTGAAQDPSAVAQFTSGTAGLLVPRLDRTSVSFPTDGLIVYDSSSNHFYGRVSGSWVQLDN